MTIRDGDDQTFDGGGIRFVTISGVTLSRVIVTANRAQDGGGIHLTNSTVVVEDSIFHNNTAAGNGGGILVFSGSCNVTNTLFYENQANYYGGYSGVGTLINCTFADNTATTNYEDLGLDAITVKNSIVWSATDSINSSGTFTYSDIRENPVRSGTGNLNKNPLFRDPTGDDYNIDSQSPVANAGTSLGAPAADLEGTTRPQGNGFSMGAYEVSGGSGQQPAGTTIVKVPSQYPVIGFTQSLATRSE